MALPIFKLVKKDVESARLKVVLHDEAFKLNLP